MAVCLQIGCTGFLQQPGVVEGSGRGVQWNAVVIVGWEIKTTDKKGSVKSESVFNEVLNLTVPEGTKSVEITSVIMDAVQAEVEQPTEDIVDVTYYNPQGMASSTPFEGLNIVKYTLGNGRTVTVKKMMGGN